MSHNTQLRKVYNNSNPRKHVTPIHFLFLPFLFLFFIDFRFTSCGKNDFMVIDVLMKSYFFSYGNISRELPRAPR